MQWGVFIMYWCGCLIVLIVSEFVVLGARSENRRKSTRQFLHLPSPSSHTVAKQEFSTRSIEAVPVWHTVLNNY